MGNFCSTHGGRTAVYSDEQAADIQKDKIRALGFSMEKTMPAGTYKRTNTPLDASRANNYTISPETLIDCMETFLTEILDRMEDSGSAEEYRKLCNGDPTTLLSMLDDEANAINENQSLKAEEARDKLIDAGFASADVPTFNLWKTAVDNLNKTVRHHERLDETKLIARYIKGVKKFGKAIAKDLKDEIRHLKGDGNSLLTLRAIRTILGDTDADEADSDIGKARQAEGEHGGRERRGNRTGANDTRERRDRRGSGHDTRRQEKAPSSAPAPAPAARGTSLTHPDRPITKEDGACRHCKQFGHWNADCPKKDTPAATGSSRVAQGIGTAAAAAASSAVSAPTFTASRGSPTHRTSIADAESIIAMMNGAAGVSRTISLENDPGHFEQANSEIGDCETSSESEDEQADPPPLTEQPESEDDDESSSSDDEVARALLNKSARYAAKLEAIATKAASAKATRAHARMARAKMEAAVAAADSVSSDTDSEDIASSITSAATPPRTASKAAPPAAVTQTLPPVSPAAASAQPVNTLTIAAIHAEARAAVAALTPTHKFKKDLVPVIKRYGLPVSPSCGGIVGGPPRTTAVVLDEMRASCIPRLPPFTAPMGLPVLPLPVTAAAAASKEVLTTKWSEAQATEDAAVCTSPAPPPRVTSPAPYANESTEFVAAPVDICCPDRVGSMRVCLRGLAHR